jgi:hypothetical protein
VTTLPAGVTLQQIDGGPTYYASNGFTFAANIGWDRPSFFPLGPWESSYSSSTDVNTWSALGWNTAYTDGGITSSLAQSNGISVIENVQGGTSAVAWARSVVSLERRWCHCPRRSPHSISIGWLERRLMLPAAASHLRWRSGGDPAIRRPTLFMPSPNAGKPAAPNAPPQMGGL